MKVYIVISGERYEDEEVSDVFSTQEAAVEQAYAYLRGARGGSATPFVQVGELMWERGYFYIRVEEWEVK